MAIKHLAQSLIQDLDILVVDDNIYMRRLTRMMLMNLGARVVYEASDGLSALEIIRMFDPDIMVIDWDIPVLNGPEVMRIVRSPDLFPRPDLPVIFLTDRTKRSEVMEALRLGANEFLVKPTSPAALRDRLLSIFCKPRPMIQIGDFYVPEPRLGPRTAPQPM